MSTVKAEEEAKAGLNNIAKQSQNVNENFYQNKKKDFFQQAKNFMNAFVEG